MCGRRVRTTKHLQAGMIATLFCAVSVTVVPVEAAERPPELQLELCTIELVDGTEVEGKLAVQFQMDDHLIVYSPRLATVRSFLKDHVHAVTVDGKREELNPKRELTDEDKKLLGRVEWPDEPPAEGLKPAYTTETWEKPKRLLVWANPGGSGRFGEPGNWLVNGSTATSLGSTEVWTGPAWGRSRGVAELDQNTDILVIGSTKSYQVRGRRGAYMARHITVESNAFLGHGIKGAYGNLWVALSGRLDGGGHASLRGTKHTFFLNGARRDPGQPLDWKTIDAKGFARKWILRKDAPQASMEFIGGIGSGDETHIVRGRGIISENSSVLIGPRCCQTVRPEGTLQLTSGSVIAKNSNQLHKQDMLVAGTLLAGTLDRPLESDCYIGISFKDHQATFAGSMWQEVGEKRGFIGFEIVPGAKVRVHSVDPTKARLVFACHQKDGAGDSGTLPNRQQEPDRWRTYDSLPRRINMVIWKDADVQFNGVVFSDMEKHGIKLQDLAMKNTWRNVFYGKNNAGSPEELYVQHEPKIEGRGNYSFPIEKAVKGEQVGGDTVFAKDAGTPIIETPEGWYPQGRTVKVVLASENSELDIRYTVDGAEPTAQSTLYKTPFTVAEDTVVKAGGFKDGKQLGETAQARFQFVAPDTVEMIESVEPGKTAAGLAYKFFDHGSKKTMPDFDSLKPAETGVARELSIASVGRRGDKFALLLEGYLQIDKPGVYNVQLDTAKADACRIYINGRRIVDNGMEELETVALVGLDKGKHKLRIEFLDNGWGELIRVALRRLASEEKQRVPAEMLSH